MLVDSTVLMLAADDVRGPEFGKATPMGLAVILILLVATFLLIRSMNRHVRKLPESFDDAAPGTGDTAPGGGDDGAERPDSGGPDTERPDTDGPDSGGPDTDRPGGGNGPRDRR